MAASYSISNSDSLNGALSSRSSVARPDTPASAVVTSNTYTQFRGGAVAFSIPPGTYGDVFETGSSNAVAGELHVSAGDAQLYPSTSASRRMLHPGLRHDNTCEEIRPTTMEEPRASSAVPGRTPIPWSFLDDNPSGLTLRGIACYSGVDDPPVVDSGPYNFQVAPLVIDNVTSATQGILLRNHAEDAIPGGIGDPGRQCTLPNRCRYRSSLLHDGRHSPRGRVRVVRVDGLHEPHRVGGQPRPVRGPVSRLDHSVCREGLQELDERID